MLNQNHVTHFNHGNQKTDLKLVFIEIKDNLKKQELHLLCHPAKPINYKRQQCIPNDGDSFLISEKHTILQIRTSLGSYKCKTTT